MTSLEQHLRDLAAKGPIRLHLWQRCGGGFQANVAEPGSAGWTVVIDEDPVEATREALRQRACGIAGRTVVASDPHGDAPHATEEQIDIEEAIADASLMGLIG